MATFRVDNQSTLEFEEYVCIGRGNALSTDYSDTDKRRTRKAREVVGNLRHKAITAAKRAATELARRKVAAPVAGDVIELRLVRIKLSYIFDATVVERAESGQEGE